MRSPPKFPVDPLKKARAPSISNFHRFQNGQIKIKKMKRKVIRSADTAQQLPKYKSPPPRGKVKVAVTNVEPDVEMFEREDETPEREALLPVKRISKMIR